MVVVVYLLGGSGLGLDQMVQVFVDPVQEPEEELLGVVLGRPAELERTLRHHVLSHREEEGL